MGAVKHRASYLAASRDHRYDERPGNLRRHLNWLRLSPFGRGYQALPKGGNLGAIDTATPMLRPRGHGVSPPKIWRSPPDFRAYGRSIRRSRLTFDAVLLVTWPVDVMRKET